jgi:uncharacterized protein (TIGR00375 family)
MRFFAELHMHSRFSRACSKDLTIKNLEKWARVKGVNILSSTDFTHPKWIKEIKAELTDDDGDGLYTTKTGFPFVMGTEISLVYTAGGKGRRVHHVVLAPDIGTVDQITEYLKSKGRIDYDGRPIFKITSPEFVEKLKEINRDIEIIPAHIWTPWFGMFGDKSGFDSMKECFEDQANEVHAIETGMSSDPAMNWRIPELDSKAIVSFSDSHSYWPWRIGRESTIFEMKKPSYKEIIRQIRDLDYAGTIETSPNYGKYHFTGHRNCNVVMSPEQAKRLNNICPACKNKLTVGVMERVEQLAPKDRPEGFRPSHAKPFHTLVPLSELISGFNRWPVASKKTWEVYNKLQAKFSNEFNILLDVPEKEIAEITSSEFAQIVLKNRSGQIKVLPGFDGVYGVPVVRGDEEYSFDALDGKESASRKKKERIGGKSEEKNETGLPASKDQKGLKDFF